MQSDSCYNSVIPRVDAVFLDHLSQDIRGTNSSAVWRYLIAYKNLLRSVLFCPNDASSLSTYSSYSQIYREYWNRCCLWHQVNNKCLCCCVVSLYTTKYYLSMPGTMPRAMYPRTSIFRCVIILIFPVHLIIFHSLVHKTRHSGL